MMSSILLLSVPCVCSRNESGIVHALLGVVTSLHKQEFKKGRGLSFFACFWESTGIQASKSPSYLSLWRDKGYNFHCIC